MVDQLKVDTSRLIEAGTALRVVATEFEHADARSDDVADAVGDDELAGKIRDFSDNWDDKRAKMLGDIQTLAESAKATGEAFEAVEQSLTNSLEVEQ